MSNSPIFPLIPPPCDFYNNLIYHNDWMFDMALFITFEGIEGCGKTTQLRLLAADLERRGYEVIATREPGGCPIGDAVRRILLDPENNAMVPRAELLLYAAGRAQHVEEVIRPALAAGRIVLCDRYIDATAAYQGFGRGLPGEMIDGLNTLAVSGLVPDLTFLLDLPVEEGLGRAVERNAATALQEDRFERESLKFHQRVREGYLSIARRESRFRIIDAGGTTQQVAARIIPEAEGVLLRQNR